MTPSFPMTPPLALALELIFLQRRAQFVTQIQRLIDEDAFPEDFEDLAARFPDVENASALKARLREIYGKESQ